MPPPLHAQAYAVTPMTPRSWTMSPQLRPRTPIAMAAAASPVYRLKPNRLDFSDASPSKRHQVDQRSAGDASTATAVPSFGAAAPVAGTLAAAEAVPIAIGANGGGNATAIISTAPVPAGSDAARRQ